MFTLHKKYKEITHLIIERSKREGKMSRYDYQHIVKPYYMILKEDKITHQPISEERLLAGFRKSNIIICKERK